jgi:hypothetical protein
MTVKKEMNYHRPHHHNYCRIIITLNSKFPLSVYNFHVRNNVMLVSVLKAELIQMEQM